MANTSSTVQGASYRSQFPLPTNLKEGLCFSATYVPNAYDAFVSQFLQMKECGFKWARQFIFRSEVMDANGRASWTTLDNYVNQLTNAGFRIIFCISDAPGYPALLTSADIALYATFCADMARRYSKLGPIFEIWNEPTGNWVGGTPDGVEYSVMALEACKAIRAAVGENAYIAGPAVEVTYSSFIQTCITKGLGSYWDLCTVHSYRYVTPPDTIRAALRTVKGIIEGSKRSIRIAVSEAGIPSTSFNDSPDMAFEGGAYEPTVAAYTGSISGATNASPIVLTATAAHGLRTGSWVTIASVGGNTAANGTWVVEALTATTFSLIGTTGNGSYTSGGTFAGAVGKNLLQWSEDLSNAIWLADTGAFVKTRCAPPLALPADTVAWNLSRNGGTGTFGIRQSTGGVSLKALNTYSISCWMRATSATHAVFLNLTDLLGVGETAWNAKFTLTTEWIKYTHTFQLTVTTTPQKFRIVSTGAAGETVDIQVCNLQCEWICAGKAYTDATYRAVQLDRQADRLVKIAQACEAEGVGLFGVYTARDFKTDISDTGTNGQNHLGITDYYGQPKPLFYALQKLVK